MGKLLSVLKALDGNKTVLGLVLLQVAGYVAEPYSGILLALGAALTGGGAVHKGLKIAKGPK